MIDSIFPLAQVVVALHCWYVMVYQRLVYHLVLQMYVSCASLLFQASTEFLLPLYSIFYLGPFPCPPAFSLCSTHSYFLYYISPVPLHMPLHECSYNIVIDDTILRSFIYLFILSLYGSRRRRTHLLLCLRLRFILPYFADCFPPSFPTNYCYLTPPLPPIPTSATLPTIDNSHHYHYQPLLRYLRPTVHHPPIPTTATSHHHHHHQLPSSLPLPPPPPHPPLTRLPQEDARVPESSWTGVEQAPLRRVSSETSVATLTISSVSHGHAGNYTCAPAALTPISVILHVLNGQSLFTDVHVKGVLQCVQRCSSVKYSWKGLFSVLNS